MAYLTRAEQHALSTRHPENRYWEVRGYPGTHDVALGDETLARLTAGADARVAIPRYDKTAFGGLGDRAAPETFTVVQAPVDVVVLEGWMLGFTPVGDAALEDPLLAGPDRALAAYAAWWARLDATVIAIAPELDRIVAWRVEAEAERRARGLGALDDAAAHAYIARFLPAYRAYVPPLRARAASDARASIVTLGADRRFVSHDPAP